jgi:DNA-binding NtrC family response regulator
MPGQAEDSDELHTRQITDAGELRYRRFRVWVDGGKEHGRTATSEGAELGIGTAPGNQLVLADDAVSRHHCVISVTPDGCWLRDTGSRNGTYVGGYRVTAARLKAGARFRVGRTTVAFERLEEEVCEPLSLAESFGTLFGRSPAMRRIFAILPRLAQSDSTVLLEGETGTGKTLLAAAIHEASARAVGPFVVVDCGALTPTLVESQLFGHTKGAFTGAQSAQTGSFQSAHRGTILLDEVGELPLELQPKLLRALEQREVTPVGTTRGVSVDVRVIAATNRDLREEVNRGRFRSDLFYRLAVVRVHVPPLRERPEDVELLARHFYDELAPDAGGPPLDLLEAWKQQRWSGNVRELRASIERALLFGREPLRPGQPAPAEPEPSFREAKERVLASFERTYLTDLVARHGGNVSQAARAARMDRNHLRELLRKYDIPLR